MAASLPSGNVIGLTMKSNVLFDMSFHSVSFSLNAGIILVSARTMNCKGLLVKTNADLSIVRDSSNLSPHTTTHIVTSPVIGGGKIFFAGIGRMAASLVCALYILFEKLVKLSSIIKATKIRHKKNNLYTDFIVILFLKFHIVHRISVDLQTVENIVEEIIIFIFYFVIYHSTVIFFKEAQYL